MKKSIIYLLFFFAVCAFFPNISFAQSAMGHSIQGTDVGLEGVPGGIIIARTKTDINGKFFFNVKAGEYKLNLLYNELIKFEIIKHRPGDDASTNKESYVFTFTPDEKSWVLLKDCVEKRMHKPFVITKELNKATPQFKVPIGGETLSGTLAYEKVK